MLVLGFVLVSLPLLLAIIGAASQLNQFSSESEALVLRGVETTEQNQILRKQLSTLERSANYYNVIGGGELLDAYSDRFSRLEESLDEAATSTIGADRKEQIRELQLSVKAFDSTVRNNERNSEPLENALQNFESIRDHIEDMTRDSNRFIDRGLNELRGDAQRVQRQLAILITLLIPFTLIVIIVFTALLARPLRQIDRAISALGDGQFSTPVEVTGPEDLQALGRQLEWLRERLMEQAREQDKFLRHMSHELKTPLANIREGTELLIDGAVGELHPPQKEVADILRENSLSLQKLIENLLSFSAWQAQLSEITLEELPLNELIRNIIEQQRLTLSARSLKIRLTTQKLNVLADPGKLRMIIDNLLSNAIKFSPDSGTIHVRTRQTDDSYIIEIADEGAGIALKERARIFEPFYQGSTLQSGHVKGTGIGLSVVRECVNAHGGKISMMDNEYPGAHFVVTLPLVPTTIIPSNA